jgi:diguanylate cyclase (GGDEF)-like protein
LSILIVDDSESIRTLFASILRKRGYSDVLLVSSAKEAFDALGMNGKPAAAGDVDVILMDVTMAEMDGIEACKHIKKDEKLRDIPTIIVTGSGDEETIQRAFDAGALDFIVKPIKKVEFLLRIKSALKLKREMDVRKARERELLELKSQLEEANANLLQLSIKDGLTGVANRRYFDEMLLKEWDRTMRGKIPLSLIMIDIDHFKAYNDTYGHQGGDDCLKKVAGALASVIKRPGDMLARYGGEEFVVVMPDTDVFGALVIAENMAAQLAELRLKHEGSKVSDIVTLSMGLASVVPEPDKLPKDIIAAADCALYKAKEEGRNMIKVAPECSCFI